MTPARRQREIALLGLASGGVVVVVAWDFVPAPFVWALLIGVGCASAAAVLARGTLRVLAVNAAVIAALLIPVESVLLWRGCAGGAPPPAEALGEDWKQVEESDAYSIWQRGGPLVRPGPVGFENRPDAHVQERMFHAGQPVYDATYTTDAHGARRTLSDYTDTIPLNTPGVLFLGCSFTFGQGLADRDTLPSRFEQAAAGRWRAVNLGVVGGAAHLALAQLEDARERAVLGERPLHGAVLVSIRHHLSRITGDVPWAEGMPRYRLDPVGVVRDGSFPYFLERLQQDAATRWRYRVSRAATLDLLVRRLPPALGIADADAADLFVGLARRIDQILRERYGAPLTVVLWESLGPEEPRVLDGLRAAGVQVLTAAEVFPDFDAARYTLPNYPHPSAYANEVLGAALAGHAAFAATQPP